MPPSPPRSSLDDIVTGTTEFNFTDQWLKDLKDSDTDPEDFSGAADRVIDSAEGASGLINPLLNDDDPARVPYDPIPFTIEEPDFDGDGIPNSEDNDDDNDDVPDEDDPNPFDPAVPTDDGGGGGDSDGDGIEDGGDNCPDTANASQDDSDGDLMGDACDNATDAYVILDNTLSPDFQAGDRIALLRIDQWRPREAEGDNCEVEHLHTERGQSGIIIDGNNGPFSDPAPFQCGFGEIVRPD